MENTILRLHKDLAEKSKRIAELEVGINNSPKKLLNSALLICHFSDMVENDCSFRNNICALFIVISLINKIIIIKFRNPAINDEVVYEKK